MIERHVSRWISRLVTSLALASTAQADTVLYDFEDGAQGWCSYGAVTTDSTCGSGAIPASEGLGYFHSGDFDYPDESSFGMVDISPTTGPLRDLSAFAGLSLDARFADVEGYPPYAGLKELHVAVATGFGVNEEEFFAPPVYLTDEFETYSFAFADFQSALTFLPPTASDLSDVTIKLVMYNENGTGTGVLIYDQVTGLDSIAPSNNADFDGNQEVNGLDFLIWQRNFGTGSMQNQGDANNSGAVDGEDLAVWEAQYGAVASASSLSTTVAVPEPNAVVLALTGFMLLMVKRFG